MATPTLRPPSPRHPIIEPFAAFTRIESAGGLVLLGCAILAMILANSPLAEAYFAFFQTIVTVGAGSFEIAKPLLLWINDGLMAIFFFLIGLEIKREVLTGELSAPRKASLAIAGALGGMMAPALVYVGLNLGGEGMSGWAIPMATDIAFALGVLALLGKRAPLALKVFLTALAIVDDLGAVIVIALFYTSGVSVAALGGAALGLAALVVANRLGARRPSVYVILGIVVWVFVLKSGVHATVAGVLVALTVPARRKLATGAFLAEARAYLDVFARDVREGITGTTESQVAALQALEDASEDATRPLQRMEAGLHGWVAFGIMPVFALANAGVALPADLGAVIASPVALGVALGLILGKPVGVFGLAWLAVKARLASLPENVTWRQVLGVSLLTGIGFTMSIFIASLAFEASPELLDAAKLGILGGSFVSGIGGWILLSRTAASAPEAA